jgi:DNA invertase Pin-like site-specific DNA recombinase
MRVVGYTRVSTREQADEGLSLDVQRRAIEDYCARKGWDLIDVIEDDGYTGTNEHRPGYAHLMDMVSRRNRPNAIVVARLDRLCRSVVNLGGLIKASKDKWGLVALDYDLNTATANGRLVAHIIGAVAEWESDMNSERTSAGMKAAHERAKATGHQFGFPTRVDEVTVQRIMRARRRGESFGAIARRLDSQRVTPPGGGARWYGSTVERIYKREAVSS